MPPINNPNSFTPKNFFFSYQAANPRPSAGNLGLNTPAAPSQTNYFGVASNVATEGAKGIGEQNIASMEAALNQAEQALQGKQNEARDFFQLAGQAEDPAHQAALLNQAQSVEGEISSIYGPAEADLKAAVNGNAGFLQTAGGVASALSGGYGLLEEDNSVRDLNAQGYHKDAWATALGEVGRFTGEVATAIPNELPFAGKLGLGFIPEALAKVGESVGDATFNPLWKWTHNGADYNGPEVQSNIPPFFYDPGYQAPTLNIGPLTLDGTPDNTASALPPGPMCTDPLSDIESQLGIDPSQRSGVTLDDIENQMGINSCDSSGPSLDDIEQQLDASDQFNVGSDFAGSMCDASSFGDAGSFGDGGFE